jgi:anti-sigma B factor antagonist
MKLNRTMRDRSVILTIEGARRITSAESNELRKQLEMVTIVGKVQYIIDFQDVVSIDSTGLSALIGFYQAIMRKGGELVLTGLKNSVKLTFELTRLHEVFSFSPDIDSAVASAA